MNDVSIGSGWESLKNLSDKALLAAVARVSRAHRVLTAELVAHLAEVDERKLYLSEATPSMFAYCVQRLGCSEDEACRRIDAARLVRKWPLILGSIRSGELSLTVLGKLRPFLSDKNASELVDAVSGLSVREAERVLAARLPKPDVADSIRKLPSGARTVQAVLATSPATGAAGAIASGSGVESSEALPATSGTNSAVRGAPSGTHTDADAASSTVARSETGKAGVAASPDGARSTSATTGEETRPAARPVDRGSFQPLSAERIQVKFTASRELEEKIALARDLMSHRNPRGDLATIFEAALDVWIADALKKKLGVTERAQRKKRPAKRERVTNATRREVLDRDGLGCAFVNEDGQRCGARAFLELDHEQAKGKGGSSEPANMRLLCRAHNQGEAERVYGKVHMERNRRTKSEDGVREPTSNHEFIIGFSPAPTRIPVLGWPVERVVVDRVDGVRDRTSTPEFMIGAPPAATPTRIPSSAGRSKVWKPARSAQLGSRVLGVPESESFHSNAEQCEGSAHFGRARARNDRGGPPARRGTHQTRLPGHRRA